MKKLNDCLETHREKACWVSVDDELPSKYENVLVFDGCHINISCVETFHENGKWITAFEDEYITHWQPLPQPPKE